MSFKQVLSHFKRRKQFIPLDKINFNIKTYKPKYNNYKRFGLLGFVFVCAITPFTNWLLIMPKMLIKYKPLWVFQ